MHDMVRVYIREQINLHLDGLILSMKDLVYTKGVIAC